jgi:hypothetical protein
MHSPEESPGDQRFTASPERYDWPVESFQEEQSFNANRQQIQQFLPYQPWHRPPLQPWTGFAIAISIGSAAYLLLWTIGRLFGLDHEFLLFTASGMESLPFLPLALLAYIGERSYLARLLASLYWLLLMVFMLLMVWLAVIETMPGPLAAEAKSAGPQAVMRSLFRPDSLLIGGLSFFGLGVALLISLAAFTPEIRRVAARIIPIDPNSFVHATALATVTCLTLASFVPLMIRQEPPLLLMASLSRDSQMSDGAEMRSTVYAFLWLVPATIIAVGYPIRRNFRDALHRVGLVRPRRWQLILAVGLVPVLIGLSVAVDNGLGVIWKFFNWPTTDEHAFGELMKFALNPLGAVIIGVTAGLGEELSVRGVLQPRLGILLSNLFFTSLHALQYNWDGLLSVFVTGLALGLIRKYTNTTTSAIVHGGFDFTLIMFDVISNS